MTTSLPDVDALIARYGAAEQAGHAKVPNRAIQAFSLDVFQAVGYPHRISSGEELWRYHDVMQDGRLEHNLGLLGSAMDGEVELVRRAANAIVDFSTSLFGFASAGRDMLSRAVYQYSLIASTLKNEASQWTILEVGPGSGYLGVLLGLAGHRYIALEASQAFWVHQSALFQHVFGEDYADGLEAADRRISHLAWWDFCSQSSTLPQLTACTANHMLNEMHPWALQFTIRKLSSTQRDGMCVVADTLGSDHLHSDIETTGIIRDAGFSATVVNQRYWVFRKTSGVTSVDHSKHFVRSLGARIYSTPFVGTAAVRTWRLIRGISESGPEASAPKSIIREIFAALPSVDSADHRFLSGTW